MRIIGGKFKKKVLTSIKSGEKLRPTSDFVREAIFNILGENITNKVFLELFAGTGAVSVEALSRGAKKVVLVEKNRKNLNLIKRNFELLNIQKSAYRIINRDCFDFLNNFDERENIDIIFADPPYNKGFIQRLLNSLKNFNRLTDDNLIILECFKNEPFDFHNIFELLKEKKYGETKLIFLKKNY